MRHARSCSTLHCMHDLSQGTLTITIKDRDIRQRSTSPTSRPHLVPNAPTVVPMSLRYHSALRSSQKLFQTRRHSLQECASAQFKLDAKARRSDTWVSHRFVFVVVPLHPTIPLHSPFISRPWRHFPLQRQVSSRRLPPHSSVRGMKRSVLSFPNRSGIIILWTTLLLGLRPGSHGCLAGAQLIFYYMDQFLKKPDELVRVLGCAIGHERSHKLF